MNYIATFCSKDSGFPYLYYVCTMEQTTPFVGSPVCPCRKATGLECVTTVEVTWQDDGVTVSFLFYNLNKPKTAKHFHFEVIDIDETIIISTATIAAAR